MSPPSRVKASLLFGQTRVGTRRCSKRVDADHPQQQHSWYLAPELANGSDTRGEVPNHALAGFRMRLIGAGST